MQRRLDALAAWLDSLPDPIRPAAYGALLIVLLMLMRGAWIVAPLAVIYVLATSRTPLTDLLHAASLVGLAMVGGGLSGLSYGLIGRHLRGAFPGSRYLVGVLTLAPYMVVLSFIIRLVEGDPVWRPLTAEDLWIGGSMALLFGIVMGHTWFSPAVDGPPARARKRKAPKRRRAT